MKVPYFPDADVRSTASLEAIFTNLEPQVLKCCNWPSEYPYVPRVELKAFHTGECLALRWEVEEERVLALTEADGGQVWTDSCVEFFFQPYGEGKYYNLEANCAGKILLAHRSGRSDAIHLSPERMKDILRYPSLGTAPFGEKPAGGPWTLVEVLPASALFEDSISSFKGHKGRFNAYKCGDNLSVPHYVSLAPIGTEHPDFHRPEYFTDIEFE